MAADFCFLRLAWTGFVMIMIKTAVLSDYATCQDDFYFRKWPVSPQGIIRTGQSLELECRVSAEDRISISWTLNGELLINSSRRYQNSTTGDLVIRRADHRLDSGDFACTATNVSSGFSIASQPATLMIHWIGNTTRINLQSLTTGRHIVEDGLSGLAQVNEREDVALQCQVEGSGEILYDWFHNGRRIPKNKTKRLTLNSVSTSASGTYTCAAKNGAGHTKLNIPIGLSSSQVTRQLVRFVKEMVATLDSAVRLPCAFQPPAQVEWHFRGSLLGQTSQYTVEADGHLVISKVNQLSEGWYHCRPSSDSDVEEYGSHLKVAYLNDFAKTAIDPPPPLNNGHHYYFAEYSTAELTCIAPDGLPSPTIWWEGPSGQVLTSPSQTSDSVLYLTRVLNEDAGTYRCRAGNEARNVSIQVNLVVTSPPMIQQHPVGASLNEDETVSMSCTFSGSPAPATIVQWLKDGQPMVDPPKPIHGHRNSTLKFVSASRRHAGNYACRLKTIGHLPVDSQTATLHVREKLKFTVPPVAKSLELGTVRKILCKAQGSPSPIVRWVKDGLKPLLWPPHIEDVNGTLVFHGVQDDDAGQYTCIATSSQGLISASILINVTMSPNFTSLPSNVTFAKEGEKVELNCRATGQPVPTIQWDKDSVMDGFTSDRFSVNRNGTLTIQNVQQEDQGFYGCTAGNAGGFKRAEFRLVVRDWEYQSGDYDGAESIAKTIIITLGAAAAYIFLSVGLLIWCRLKRRQRKLRSPNDGGGTEAQLLDVQTALLTKEEQGENGGRQSPAIDKLNVPNSAITKGALQGKGRFGDILEGSVTGLSSSEGSTRVLLRILNTREEDLNIEFRQQVDMLHRIRHANLVAVLGCCRDSPDFQMILMEYHQMSNLKLHLLSTSSSQQPWSLAKIQSATIQIARGMNALAEARFVHRDLGTRNILVGFHGKDNHQVCVKIGSFGMDKKPFNNDYYVYKHQSIALRWLPHEAVLEDEYSTKSDVWMFAVTIWELHNAAQQPLSTRSDEVLLADLRKKSSQLWDASFCKSNAMSSLLVKCWSHDPLLRPSFDELLQCAESTSALTPSSNGESKPR